jgi:hypothetical protein
VADTSLIKADKPRGGPDVKIFCSLLILLFFITQPFSQETTGNLEGWILGTDNKPLPDVNISVFSLSLQGLRGAASNKDGYFRVVALPVGNYTVEISHLAFTETTYQNVKIQLGKTTTLGEIALQPKTMQAPVVNVIANRQVIDPTTTTSGLNLEHSYIEPLPLERDYFSAVALAPQANASFYGDQVNIAGGTGMENAYYIDGVNVTNPSTAFSGTNLPYNFVREIELKTGGYEAEYGSALGGVVNVITNSGGNSLSGNMFGFFTNNKFTGERRTGVVSSNVTGFSSYDFGGNLGGPLIKDKLWYFIAYNPQFNVEDIKIPGLGSYQDRLETHIFAGKLSWRVSDKSNLIFNTFGDPNHRDIVGESPLFGEIPFTQSLIENEDVLLDIYDGGGYNFSLNFKSLLTNKFLLESNIAYFVNRENARGATERGRSEPIFIDQETGTYSGGRGIITETEAIRTSADIKTSFFLGRHILKTGLNYEDNSARENTHTIGPGIDGAQTVGGIGFIIRTNDSLYSAFSVLRNAKVSHRIPAFYIQDDWRVTPRLLLKAGLRWSAEYMIGSDGKLVQRINNELQPRVGFVFQPGRLGSQKIYGYYGRFYEKIPNLFSSYNHANWQSYFFEFDHNPLENPADGDTVANLGISIPEEVKGLQGQYSDEFILGYEREVGERIRIGIQGIYRNLGQVIEDAYNPELNHFLIGNPGRGNLSFVPRRKRIYSALQISFRMSGETGVQMYAAYTLSRLYGNYVGLYDQDAGQLIPNSSPNADFAEQEPNSTGLLPGDRTHVFKLWGSYPLKFGLNVGSTFIWQSGSPLNNLGVLSYGFAWYAFQEKRGSVGRMPDLWDLSVRLSYNLDMVSVSYLQSKLILDLLHIGSLRRAVDFDQIHYFATDENGNPTDENPDYLKPIQFQSPFTFRIGLEMGF